MKRRIAITGLGVVSPVGIGKENYWDSVVNGRTNYREITRFPLESWYKTRIAAEIDNFRPEEYVDSKILGRIRDLGVKDGGLSIYYGTAAAKLAIDDSGLDFEQEDPSRIGASAGTFRGDMAILTHAEPSLKYLLYSGPNVLSACIALEYGLGGPVTHVPAACATGNKNMEAGYKHIVNDDADVMIVGSSSAPLVVPHPFEDLSKRPSPMSTKNDIKRGMRPFDKERDGFVLSEGSGFLILEDLDHALGRDAHIYAEVIGYGNATCTSVNFADVSAKGYTDAMRRAIQGAGLSEMDLRRKEIYINAHGTATKNDIVEPEGIRMALGNYSWRPFVGSIKGSIGHAQEAVSSLELVSCALALDEGIIPPNAGLETIDPECGNMNFVKGEKTENGIDIVIKNAAAFGGLYSTIILGKYRE